MKLLKVLILSMAVASITGYAQTTDFVREARAIEAEMKQVKPDFFNQKTIDRQLKLIDKSSDFVKSVISGRNPTPSELELATRIMVKISPYEQQHQVMEENYDDIEKHWAAIEKILQKFESQKTFPRAHIEGVRTSYDVISNLVKYGNDPDPEAERAPNKTPAKKPKK